MNILIYYQNPYHTVFLESLAKSFIEKGHKVHFLTTCEEGILHERMRSFGAKVETRVIRGNMLSFYPGHLFFLVRFCRKNRIDVVYSHLQTANLVAVIAGRFLRARVFPCRHHSDDVFLRGNRNALRQDRLVNRFAKKIIAVSKAVKEHMIQKENVDPEKIEVIRLGYYFDLYDRPDPITVERIRTQMNCRLLVIVIGRMNQNKNHIAALKVLLHLVSEGMDVKMIIMDEGPEKNMLESFVRKHDLEKHVLFTGFLNNTMDHLAASDLLLHPSLSEASNQVVKEAALLEKPSVVCAGVGDFDEYIVHGQNGFIVSKENVTAEMTDLVKELYNSKELLERTGKNAGKTVRERFAIGPVSNQYLKLAEK